MKAAPEAPRPAYAPLRPVEILSYALGDAGFNFYWAPMSAFLMIYLTDVGPDDQNFAFCLGTQRGFRTTKYEKSRFTDQQLSSLGLAPLEVLAPAGTAVVFDSSGIHRLRRRDTRVRDSVTFNYRPNRLCPHVPLAVHGDSLVSRRSEFERVTTLAN